MKSQPPSGGCVLKHDNGAIIGYKKVAAAFGRLCVETAFTTGHFAGFTWQPPSGGCVLKHHTIYKADRNSLQPPSGGCVLKLIELESAVT